MKKYFSRLQNGPDLNDAQERRQLWLSVLCILLIAVPVLFFYLGGWSFFDPDEGRYGSIPRQMLMHHDFVTPTQNNIKFFDKPPLLYWAIAASYSAFGYHEWAARLVPALAALMGIFAVYFMGRRMFGSRAGLIGAVILATTCMWPVMARIVVTDMLVSSLIFTALTFWWLGHTEPNDTESTPAEYPHSATNSGSNSRAGANSSTRRQTCYFLGFWITLALGVLAKGPMAVVLSGSTLFLYMLICRQWKALSSMRWCIGLPVFAAIAVPWFVLVGLRNPEFNHYFWYDQHIGRFLGHTTGNDHVQAPWYYLKFLPLLFFPWSFFLPAAIVAGCKHLRYAQESRRRAAIFLMCAAGFILLFFSISSGKLFTYILPAFPPLALLIAAYFEWLYARRTTWNRVLSIVVSLLVPLLLIAGAALIAWAPRKLAHWGIGGTEVLWLGVLIIAWGLVIAGLALRYRLNGLIAGTTAGFTLVFAGAMPLAAELGHDYTTGALVRYITPGLTPDAEVLSISYIQSLEFYTGHRVEVIGTPAEMDLGVQHMPAGERREWIFNGPRRFEHVKDEMKDIHPIYCFARIDKRRIFEIHSLIHQLHGAAVPIIANQRFLIFGNRAAAVATPPVPSTLGAINRL